MDFEKRYERALSALRRTPVGGPDRANAAKEPFGRRRSRLGLLAPVGALLLIVSVSILVLPMSAPALSLDAMRRAVLASGSYHMIETSPSGDVRREVWSKGDKTLYALGAGWTMCRGDGWEWRITPWAKTAVIARPMVEDQHETYDNLDDLILRLQKGVTDGSTVRKASESKDIQRIAIEGKWIGGRTLQVRYVITANSKSRLPSAIETYTRTVDSVPWKLSTKSKITFGVRLNDSIFEFRPPKGYVVYDDFQALKMIEDGVAGNRPKVTVGGVTVTLLGAFHERSGWVRILWCGGATPPANCEAGVLDEKRVGYVVETEFESDDRNRPRNHGIAPKGERPKMQRVGFDRPYQIRPLFWVKGTPIYCLRTTVEYAWPLRPRKLKVILPVCQEGEPKDIKLGSYGMTFRSNGVQVGSAEFEVETLPVSFLARALRSIDPNMMHQWSCAPVKSVRADQKRSSRIILDNELKFMRAQQADANASLKAYLRKGSSKIQK